MKKITPKILIRNIALVVLSLAVTGITWQQRNAKSATESNAPSKNEYIELVQKTRNVDDVIAKYNDDMNKLFNDRIKRMVAVLNMAEKDSKADPKALSDLFKPPAYNEENGIQTTRKSCDELKDNLSTYCLSLDATKKYFLFRDALLEARKVAEQTAGDVYAQTQSGATTKGDLGSAGRNLLTYGKTIEKINLETDIARQTLDQALAAYNEMQFALPMHTKYMQIVKSLEQYRDKVADIRRNIEQFPATFLDVTTTQCT